MAKDKEDKIVLEREYIVPLRKRCLYTPRYRRTPKAVKELKIFLAKHMKLADRDVGKVKLDKYLNEELWFKGIRKPPAKIKVKAKKLESGIVGVELAEVPQVLKFRIEKEKRIKEKKIEKKPEDAEVKKEEQIEKTEEKEKTEAVKESEKIVAESQAKEIRHEIKRDKNMPKHQFRKALQK